MAPTCAESADQIPTDSAAARDTLAWEGTSSVSHGLVSPFWRDNKSTSQDVGANLFTFGLNTIRQLESDRSRRSKQGGGFLQGYLAHKKRPPPRTLQQAYT